MQVTVAHRTERQARFSTPYKFTGQEAAALRQLLHSLPGIDSVFVYKRTGSIRVFYQGALRPIFLFLKEMNVPELSTCKVSDYRPEDDTSLFDIVRDSFQKRFVISYLLPAPIRTVYALYGAACFIRRGITVFLRQRRLCVELMDSIAISTSLLSGDFRSAGTIMWLLGLGSAIEDWTMEKSKEDLARGMALNIGTVWVKNGEQRQEKPLCSVLPGDIVEITSGHMIPVDGLVCGGEAAVNQSSFTGEALPVHKTVGHMVFAGTTVEEGYLTIEVRCKADDSRIQMMIRRLYESEQLKSNSWKNAESMADRLVKYSFLGAFLTFLLTRQVERAKAFLMVDYSCALKLAIPIATMTAMRQSAENMALVKGGIHLENLAQADTLVLDKTGTLTHATPSIARIIAFEPFSEQEVLAIGACLEEHFPHPIANAVVAHAKQANVLHDLENHSRPDYITAHGIVAQINGKRAVIGSAHFLFEDEGIALTAAQKERLSKLGGRYSLLYLAMEDRVIGVFCIHDPVRDEMPEVLNRIRTLGIERIVMLTGDSENAARFAAQELCLDEYHAQMLPEEKADFIKNLRKEGHNVIMVGDGINDILALSNATVGIAMNASADVASNVADILLKTEDLAGLIDLLCIARAMNRRIQDSYRKIVAINTLLIALGTAGLLSGANASFAHNFSTFETALTNLRPYRL